MNRRNPMLLIVDNFHKDQPMSRETTAKDVKRINGNEYCDAERYAFGKPIMSGIGIVGAVRDEILGF